MTALMNNVLLAVEISQTTLIVLMAVLIVLIILLAVLATIFILGVKRKNEAKPQLDAVTVVADFDNSLGTIILKDENDVEKSIFKPGETVKVAVKANEGYLLSDISIEVNENVIARFKPNGSEKKLYEGVYEFVITSNTVVKVQFEADVESAPEVFTFDEQFNGIGGRVILANALGEEKNQFVAGEIVKISTVADDGYYLAYFAIDDEEKELVEGVYEFVVTAPVKINVEFLPKPAVRYSVTVQTSNNGVISVTNENGEEQDVDKELHEFVINADAFISATFEAIPVAVEEAEVVAVNAEDEDEDEEVMFDGHNVIRFNKSFTAKLIQIDEVSNSWYTELKNELLSYKKVKDRMSWKRESYRFGKVCVARFVIRGKTLCIQLPLDPTQYEDTKYKVEDISHIVSSADTPCLYRIKNERRLNYAKDLIAQVMENMGAERIQREWVDYNQPYDTTLNLIERQLVKKVVKFNGKTGYGGIVEKLTEDPTKVQETKE
ncbi:MAG: hypothetical protein K2L52_00150 [Clostridia bacterium]|nr:hypothetical protein [Clostridia bacterium]